MTESSDLAAREGELNRMILAGEALEAFERFYHDDVVMQENTDPPVRGKEANRQREQALIGNLAAFEAELVGAAVGDDLTYSEWIYTFTFRDGSRQRLHEVSARRWRDGEVISERFYFDR
jgi:ketosteroid isomerase-like protein